MYLFSAAILTIYIILPDILHINRTSHKKFSSTYRRSVLDDC